MATLSAAPQVRAQTKPKFHLRSGLVAYSYRKELAAKSLTYEDLIRMMSDWGLDGLDCTVYWLPENSPAPTVLGAAAAKPLATSSDRKTINTRLYMKVNRPFPAMKPCFLSYARGPRLF